MNIEDLTKELEGIEESLKLSSLSPAELLSIIEIEGKEFIIPMDIATRLKGVSRQALWLAISKGIVKTVEGVTLSSLVNYHPNPQNKLAGITRAMKAKEEDSKEKGEKENG